MKTTFFASSFRLFLGLALVGSVLGLGACATAPTDGAQYLPADQRPSSLPWNTPESWEGKGQLGNLGTGAQSQGTQVGTGVH